MKTAEPILIDSSILIYAHNSDAALHTKALAIVQAVFEGKLTGVITHQNLLELYSVITDKRRVATPLSPEQAQELITSYFASPFQIVLPTTESGPLIASLSKKTQSINGHIFDVYLVATMLSNNISTLLTANAKDFTAFSEITVLDFPQAWE